MGDTRVRTKADSALGHYLLQNRNYTAGYVDGAWKVIVTNPVTVGQGSRSVLSTTKTMTDVVTPHYSRRIANGDIINSPMQSNFVSAIRPLANVDARRFVTNEYGAVYQNFEPYYIPGVFLEVGSERHGTYPAQSIFNISGSHLSPAALNVASLVDQAVTQAHANVDMSEAQTLMMVAEGEKTIQSLSQIFKRAVKLLRIVRKLSNFQGLSRKERKFVKENFTPKELANRYMEVRYSLRPLLYDAAACVKALQPTRFFDRFTSRGFAEDKSTIEKVGVVFASSTSNTRVVPITRTTRSVQVRAGVLTTIDSNTVLNTWGFRSTD